MTNYVEQPSLSALIQFGAKMEINHPFNINSVMVGRRTVARNVDDQFNKLLSKMKNVLMYSISEETIGLTCDMWTDKFCKRSYLDISAFYLPFSGAKELEKNGSML